MDKAMPDFLVARDGAIADVIDHTPRAASIFIDPTGEVINEVLQDEERIAYAEIDLELLWICGVAEVILCNSLGIFPACW
jgi:hypothetical protein